MSVDHDRVICTPHGNRRRLRVLIVASMCNPERGSEPGLGWKWSSAIARHHDVTVITSEYQDNRNAIHRALEADADLAASMRFEFVPWFEATRPAWQRELATTFQLLYYTAYDAWMREAQAVARRLFAQDGRFDLTHQLTMIGFREPGYLWELPVPFVWGPVGGTQNVPWRLLPSLGLTEGMRHGARNCINEWQKRFHRRSKCAFQKAAEIIAVASDTQEELRRHHHVESRVIAAAMGEPGHLQSRVRVPHTGPTRFVFTGLHLSRKGLPFALRALARLPTDLDWTLDVMGTGPLSRSWQSLTRSLGLQAKVVFHGHVPRETLMRLLDNADVYVFPSLLEGWPAAIIEALTLGLPVVTTALHGMRDMVTTDCGRLVPATTASGLIEGLAAAFEEMIRHPQTVEKLSSGALRRVEELGPEVQVPLILDAYDAAVGSPRHSVNGR
jgi:glycosyltransferase involved in cell wall biosynthesis